MRRVPAAMVVSAAIGVACVAGGLAISFHYGTAGGATIAELAVLVFFVAFAVREVTTAVRRRTRGTDSTPA